METEEKKVPVVDDEAELDKLIEADIAIVRAEKPLAPPAPAATEAKPAETVVTEPVKPTEEQPSPAPAPAANGTDDTQKSTLESFNAPKKGPNESEESYQTRVELAQMVAERKAAKTPEEKQALQDKIAKKRAGLRQENTPITPKPGESAPQPTEDDLKKAAALTAIKEAGGATTEDVEQILAKRDFANSVRTTIDSFIARHPELKDEDHRDAFLDFVDGSYNWIGKTGPELMTVLELAHNNAYPQPAVNGVQERVIVAAGVQEKVNAMQFPGGTITKNALSPEVQKSVDEMKATGMSEEKALELLSED